MIKGNNELIPMTRRIPNKLKYKQLKMDSKVSKKLIQAWDEEHDSDKVFDIFLKYKDNLSNQRYWEILRTVWIISGSIERSSIFRRLMGSSRSFKHWFSTPEEINYLESLPDIINVFRCTNDVDDDGLSWTLSINYAKQYQIDFDKKYIIQKTFSKDKVFAYINRNNEQEIIIL